MFVDCGRFVVERFILNVETEDSLTCVDFHMLADMFESFSSTLQLSISLLSMCAYLSQCLWLSPLKSSSLAISLRYWASLYSSLSFSRLRWAFMKGRIYQTQTHTKQVSATCEHKADSDEEENILSTVTVMLAGYLQSVLWIHEEVSSDVIKHYGVLPVVKFSVFPPYHTQRLHLDTDTSENTLYTCFYLYHKAKNTRKRLVIISVWSSVSPHRLTPSAVCVKCLSLVLNVYSHRQTSVASVVCVTAAVKQVDIHNLWFVPTSTTPLFGVCTVIIAALSNMNVIL